MKAIGKRLGYREGMRKYQAAVIMLLIGTFRREFEKYATMPMVTGLYIHMQNVIVHYADYDADEVGKQQADVEKMDRGMEEYFASEGISLRGLPTIECAQDRNWGMIARRCLYAAMIALHEIRGLRFGEARLRRYAQCFIAELNGNPERYRPAIGQPVRQAEVLLEALGEQLRSTGLEMEYTYGRLRLCNAKAHKVRVVESDVEVTAELIREKLAAFGLQYDETVGEGE